MCSSDLVITVAAVCCAGYAIIGVLNALKLMQFAIIALPVSIILLIIVLFIIRAMTGGKEKF